jgi:hypothetical protein
VNDNPYESPRSSFEPPPQLDRLEQLEEGRGEWFLRANDRAVLMLVVLAILTAVMVPLGFFSLKGEARVQVIASCLVAALLAAVVAWYQSRHHLVAIMLSSLCSLVLLWLIYIATCSALMQIAGDPPRPPELCYPIMMLSLPLTLAFFAGLFMVIGFPLRVAIQAATWYFQGIDLRHVRDEVHRHRSAQR